MSTDVTLTIDGREVTVPAGTLVIRAAEQLGIYVPRFCDHPLLDPAGACRQCIVEVEGHRKPLTACTTVATAGMAVRTQMTSSVAKDAQEGVLELLLINHPLDCPMCDKGGECPLQDQALAYGPGGSRYIDPKRRFTKPVAISPLIKLDRERCVLCARCTRFSEQIAGDPFIELFERGALEQVAIYEDEPYRSELSGNVVQICPVGALTSSEFRFLARPFDMTTTVSTCNRCASGCKILVQERRGALVRVLSGSDPAGQDEWICDKGRFGYLYAQTTERVTEPLVRKDASFVAVSWAEAIATAADAIRGAREARRRIAVLGGSQLLDEDAYALGRFARVVCGSDDVDARVGDATAGDVDALAQIAAGAPTAGFSDLDAAATVVVCGVDLREVSPIVALRVRKHARAGRLRVIEVGARRSRFDEVGASFVPCLPGAEASTLPGLTVGDGPVVLLVGDSLIGDGGFARAWNAALDRGWTFGWVPRKANARGALVAGCAPGLLPGGRRVEDATARAEVQKRWNAVPPAERGRNGAETLRAASDVGLLITVGADPVADAAGALHAGAAVDAIPFTIAIDLFLTETARRADLVLPAAALYERSGSLTGWDGVARTVRAAVRAPGLAQPDWSVLAEIAAELGHAGFPATRDGLREEMSRLCSPRTTERTKVEVDDPDQAPDDLVLLVRSLLLDAGAMMHGADALAATAPSAIIEVHPDVAQRAGIGQGARVCIQTGTGKTTGVALITDRVAPGVVTVPAQQGTLDGIDLADASGFTRVKLTKEDA